VLPTAAPRTREEEEEEEKICDQYMKVFSTMQVITGRRNAQDVENLNRQLEINPHHLRPYHVANFLCQTTEKKMTLGLSEGVYAALSNENVYAGKVMSSQWFVIFTYVTRSLFSDHPLIKQFIFELSSPTTDNISVAKITLSKILNQLLPEVRQMLDGTIEHAFNNEFKETAACHIYRNPDKKDFYIVPGFTQDSIDVFLLHVVRHIMAQNFEPQSTIPSLKALIVVLLFLSKTDKKIESSLAPLIRLRLLQ